MIEFRLPSLGADMDEGTLLTWHVKAGDTVQRGQVVAVVDTSKAAVDVEIWHDGVVGQLLIEPGTKVPVGTALATILAPGEAADPMATATAPPPPIQKPTVPTSPSPTPKLAPETAEKAITPTRRPVTPAARRRAQELGIDSDSVKGTGAQSSVTVADIEAAASTQKSGMPAIALASSTPAPSAPTSPADRAKEMRKAIAAAMGRSKREIPHYYLSETIPMALALDWLAKYNASHTIAERLLPAVLMLKAVAVALKRTPQLHGFYVDGAFQPATAIHAGVAISLRGGGLVAPAIHDVGSKPLDQLMRDLTDLVKRARAGSLRSSEMSDPTITVTNLGDQGVEAVFGVIYPPQVALVGFGSVQTRPWVQDGVLCALPLVTASLAADHRASDGHQGALFLAELRAVLQQPDTLAEAVHKTPPQGDPT
ncbi:dihydrolipoamide acetyltransferase family protein [Rhodoferax sp. PAMC 29310]|uniref:dihydrolipoamide acetyltransferase family protein n=1 Tax=Rhodoferax sp. PAMC 29310 TaxID=2822760 RepID=UPI001B32A4C6|nr:dihydrolipoamide acetyltransferase family protein [Rhodoferax sp. PAMC 29310]